MVHIKKKYSVWIILAIMIVGVVGSVYLVSRQQNLQSNATSFSQNKMMTLLSPEAGSTLSGVVDVTGSLTTGVPLQQLYALYKVDDQNPTQLLLDQTTPGTLQMKGLLDTKAYAPGAHTLQLSVYDLSSGKPELLDQLSLPMTIAQEK